MKNISLFLIVLFTLFLLNSCTADNHNLSQCVTNEPKGFLFGLWHGLISPITLIISLFNENITIYESSNNGGWYNVGFVWGCALIFGGSSSTSYKSRK